jgi:butyrate kinase
MQNTETNRILIINPGSTSTKIAVFDGDEELFTEVIRHDKAELDACGSIRGQKEVRLRSILNAMESNHVTIESLSAVAARGGLLRPIKSGVYAVNENMLSDLQTLPKAALHASSLSAVIAKEIANQVGVEAYIVDPVVVDEMEPCARLTGLPEIESMSIVHALNQKAIARRFAKEQGVPYECLRLIVAHMGGGISVGAHRQGRIIDTNDALTGEGPFTPERAGQLPSVALIALCFSGKYTEQELSDMVMRNGGMQRYIGTNDMRVAEKMIQDGDEKAKLVVESMAYQVSKEIGAMAAVLDGRVDAIALTGGLAYSEIFTDLIKQRVSAFAPVLLYPGEDEMLALANGVIRVLRGQETPMEYTALNWSRQS